MELSRQQRRAIAKKLGLIKQNESFSERSARINRSIEAGRQMHLQHLQDLENSRNNLKNLDEIEEPVTLTPSSWDPNTNWNLEEFKKTISGETPEE